MNIDCILCFYGLTDGSFVQLGFTELKNVLNVSAVFTVDSLNVQTKLLNKRAGVSSSGVRVGIPSLFLHDEGRFGQKSLEPT